MKKNILFVLTPLFIGLFFRGIDKGPERIPAQNEVSQFFESDLLETSKKVGDQLARRELSISVCHNEINDSFSYLSAAPSNFFETVYKKEEYANILKRIWHIKSDLRRHLLQWKEEGLLTKECGHIVKRALRASRYIEDNVALLYLKKEGKPITGFETKKKLDIFSKGFPWVMSEKGDFDFKRDLRSGDLILWRGKTAISASIARLGDSETNFSHLSIVYRDPKTKKLYHVESLIETGLIYEDITNKSLHPASARAVILRHDDEKLAARAAKFVFEKARKTMGTDDHLHYDFGFDLEDHNTVFCSEVVAWAYSEASKGELQIPLYKTKFDMKNRSFINKIGTDATEGFQPGDIEITPEFKMVAEWRDFHFSRSNQLKDVIHSNFYRWMDRYNYNFKWSFKGNVLGTAVFGIRRVPLVGGLLEDTLPLSMKRETLSAVLTMSKVSEKIFDVMKKRLFKKDPYALYSHAHLERELEKFRQEDLEVFKAQVRANRMGEAHHNPKFHHHFGPSKKEL